VADDNADLRDYLARLLGGRWEVTTVADGQAALELIATRLPDLVLSDVMMPRLDGLGLVAALRSEPRTREVPIILLSARADEAARIEGLGAGADDYLVKPFSAREVVARVEGALALQRVRRESAEAIRRREQQFASLADNLPDLVARYDRELRHLYVNRAVTARTGRPFDYWLGRRVADGDGPPELVAQWTEVLSRVLASGEAAELEFELPTDGSRHGAVTSVISIARDVTAQRQSEARLRQAAKMEAIGRLAGGIAHDFNNQLHGVAGFAGFVARDPGLGARARGDLEEIQKATERMAGLTRQLLAFSRQQVLQPETIDVNAAVADARSLLQRLLGSTIRVALELAAEPGWILADRSQLLQVLLNLAINARDAMPDGGVLTIRTGASSIPDRSARVPAVGVPVAGAPLADALGPGDYVVLTVTDTGCGIPADDLPHIFDPFFTTKEVGKGTGLGLATVHGIVAQSGGHIRAESRAGQGATFTLHFPRAAAPAPASGETDGGRADRPRPARILVVDDEDVVRVIVSRTLELEGYTVLQADSGRAALACLAREAPVDLVVSDVIMPEMAGHELAARLAAGHPGLPVIWMSGYPRDALPTDAVDGGALFLQKPIPADLLAGSVREVLARRSQAHAPPAGLAAPGV
jgi:signal transduction histidine kinase